MTPWTHRYHWGNNPVRARYKGQRCRVLAKGAMQTVLIELEDGTLATTSLRGLRRLNQEARLR